MKNIIDIIKDLSAEQETQQGKVENRQESGQTASQESPKKLNNQAILEHVRDHFKHEMYEKSFLNVITFPMSFTIILNQNDYDAFKDYSGLVSKYIVRSFYEVVRAAITEGQDKVCENLATYWNFSFLQCEDEPVTVDNKVIHVEEGDYYICSTVHDLLIDQVEKSGESGSTISISKGGSKIYGNININRESLKSLRIVGQTHFQMDWDPGMNEVAMPQQGSASNVSTAVGELNVDGKVYKLTSGTYMVSGLSETRTNSNIIIVNSHYVKPGHVHIQYIEKDNKFKIAAFEETELSGKTMPISSASEKCWVDLNDGADIELAGDTVMVFRALV